ncbi:MAG: arginase family protein [Planctomycetota bacterium]|jgi:arginase
MEVAFAKMPYTGARNVPELSAGPAYLDCDQLHERLREVGVEPGPAATVRLDARQEAEDGQWHRMGLACGNLATLVADQLRHGRFVIGLLGNCTALLGMLAGLQRPEAEVEPRRVGMLFLDAHADFNTPETTLSGMLGGMPVAAAAGLCLSRLRLESGLDPAVTASQIVMGGLRDVDPLEQELIDQQGIKVLSVEDVRARSPRLRQAMQDLSSATDAVYVHVDMDVLDTSEVPGHPTAVPGGLSSDELAGGLAEFVANEKVLALGIASTPANERDETGVARRAAHRLIAAAAGAVGARATATA